jgi:hypothetical protein
MLEYLYGTRTKSKWEWITKYIYKDIEKKLSNSCLSVKHTQ